MHFCVVYISTWEKKTYDGLCLPAMFYSVCYITLFEIVVPIFIYNAPPLFAVFQGSGNQSNWNVSAIGQPTEVFNMLHSSTQAVFAIRKTPQFNTRIEIFQTIYPKILNSCTSLYLVQWWLEGKALKSSEGSEGCEGLKALKSKCSAFRVLKVYTSPKDIYITEGYILRID